MTKCLLCRGKIPDGQIGRHGPSRCTTGRTAVVEKATNADLAKLGAAVASVELQRESVAKQLDEAASRWEAKAANRTTATHNDVTRYFADKAASAREKAAALRRGEKV